MTTKIRNILIGITLAVVLLLLAFCSDQSPQYYQLDNDEIAQLTKSRKLAYDYAVECSGIKNPKIKFEDISWVLAPGSSMNIKAIDGQIDLKGYFSPMDTVIYMPFTERHTDWIMSHEVLHAIGIIGHPRIPFEYPCRVMAHQNP